MFRPSIHPNRCRACLSAAMRLSIRIVIVGVHQSCDATHSIRLLRPRRERPCHRRAAYERDEVTPSHNLVSTVELRLHTNVVESELCRITNCANDRLVSHLPPNGNINLESASPEKRPWDVSHMSVCRHYSRWVRFRFLGGTFSAKTETKSKLIFRPGAQERTRTSTPRSAST